jgi:hypothetical protein
MAAFQSLTLIPKVAILKNGRKTSGCGSSRRRSDARTQDGWRGTDGAPQSAARGWLPVNAVVTRACWDGLIADKDVRRETRVWDLLMAVRLRLGGGMGNMPIHGTSSFEVACGSNVGTVTVHVCCDCVLISLRRENLTLPAKDQHGSLESSRGE